MMIIVIIIVIVIVIITQTFANTLIVVAVVFGNFRWDVKNEWRHNSQ